MTEDVVALAGKAWTVEGGRGSIMEGKHKQVDKPMLDNINDNYIFRY